MMTRIFRLACFAALCLLLTGPVHSAETGAMLPLFGNMPEFQLDVGDSAGTSANANSESSCGESEEMVLRGASKSSLSKQIRSKTGLSRLSQIWVNGYLGGGSVEPEGIPDMDTDLSGAMVGLNFNLLGGTVSGYYNYNKYITDVGSESVRQVSNLGGISWSNNASCIYWSLAGAGGVDDYKFEVPTQGELDFDGWQAMGLLEVGGEMDTGGLFTLRPFSMIQYNYLKHDELTNFFEEQTCSTLWTNLGARVDLNLLSDLLTIQGRFAWVHQALSDNDPINCFWFSRVPGTVTPSQCHFAGTTGRDYFWGGLGLRLSFMSRLAVTLDYDVLCNKYLTTQLGSVGLLVAF